MAGASSGIRSIGYEVQTLHRPCNGDIWMWIEPVKRISEDGTEYSLVLLDVEGADSDGIVQTLGVNDIALDLSRLLEISMHDQVGEAKDNTFPGLGQFSPILVQLMTLEKLQPQLLYGIDALTKFVSKRVRPKKRGDTIVTGPPLACFTKSFTENVNSNTVPKISSLWLFVEELEGRRARDTAAEVYMLSLEHPESPEESMLIEAHNKAVVKALTAFSEPSIGNLEVFSESADNVSPYFVSPSKDDLLEEACKKYDEATRLCPTLYDVCINRNLDL